MGRRFRGESVHKVDAKGRVSIPAPFRRVLEEGDPDCATGDSPTFIIVYGLNPEKKYLECYSIDSMERFEDSIGASETLNAREKDALIRMITTRSAYANVDENGRIVLKDKLRERAEIGKEAMFAGMIDKFQIWNPDAYKIDDDEVDDWVANRPEGGGFYSLLDRLKSEG